MSTYLPKDVQDGLQAARLAALKKTSRLRVSAGDQVFPVLRMWETGFAVEAAEVPRLRGLVDLFNGTHHLYQCLIVADEEEAGEMRYGFKRNTAPQAAAALDFYREVDAPVALIGEES